MDVTFIKDVLEVYGFWGGIILFILVFYRKEVVGLVSALTKVDKDTAKVVDTISNLNRTLETQTEAICEQNQNFVKNNALFLEVVQQLSDLNNSNRQIERHLDILRSHNGKG